MNRFRESCDKFDATVQFMFLSNAIFLVGLNSIVFEGSPLPMISIRRFQTIQAFQTTSEKVFTLCCKNVPNLLGVEISQDVDNC